MCQYCSPCSQGLPQWILSHFSQTPPLTDHTAAFKGLKEHQRQLCDFAFLSRALQPLELPLWREAQLRSFPQPSLMIFQTHAQSLAPSCIIEEDSIEKHEASSLLMTYMYLLWAKEGWRRARTWHNGTVRISDSVAGCSTQNIIYSSRWREITAAILSRSRKTSWPGNTKWGQEEGQAV